MSSTEQGRSESTELWQLVVPCRFHHEQHCFTEYAKVAGRDNDTLLPSLQDGLNRMWKFANFDCLKLIACRCGTEMVTR